MNSRTSNVRGTTWAFAALTLILFCWLGFGIAKSSAIFNGPEARLPTDLRLVVTYGPIGLPVLGILAAGLILLSDVVRRRRWLPLQLTSVFIFLWMLLAMFALRSRHWVCLAMFGCLLSASFVTAARIVLDDRATDAVFIGQVVSDESVSITNVINAERGVYMISEVKVARVRIESVLNQDQAIPCRFPDEALVYYNWYIGQTLHLSARQRKRLHCDRGNVLGRTNVLILVAASPVTN